MTNVQQSIQYLKFLLKEAGYELKGKIDAVFLGERNALAFVLYEEDEKQKFNLIGFIANEVGDLKFCWELFSEPIVFASKMIGTGTLIGPDGYEELILGLKGVKESDEETILFVYRFENNIPYFDPTAFSELQTSIISKGLIWLEK